MKKQGNITILVLFILVACSLLGVLTIHYIDQMFGQSRSMGESLQARYSAQAGKEYALSVIPLHGPWFQEHFISTGYEWDIFGRSNLLSASPRQSTGCAQSFSLSSGQSLVIPLFVDDGEWPVWTNVSNSLPDINFVAPTSSVLSSDEVSAAILVVSGDALHPDGIFVRTGNMNMSFFSDLSKSFDSYVNRMAGGEIWGDFRLMRRQFSDYPYKNFLVLANRHSADLRFCLSTKIPLATDRFWIVSKGTIGQEVMAIDTFSAQPVPNFALSSLIE